MNANAVLKDFVMKEPYGRNSDLFERPYSVVHKNEARTIATDGKILVIAPAARAKPVPEHHMKLVVDYIERPMPPTVVSVGRQEFSDWLGPCAPVREDCFSCKRLEKRGGKYGEPCHWRVKKRHMSECDNPDCVRGFVPCENCGGTGTVEDLNARLADFDGVVINSQYVRKLIDLPWFASAVQFEYLHGEPHEPTVWRTTACVVWLMPVTPSIGGKPRPPMRVMPMAGSNQDSKQA